MTELSNPFFKMADEVLEEMRGGPILAVSPARSRDILARALSTAYLRGLDAGKQLQTKPCGRCAGAGSYMEQYDEEKYPVKIDCETCAGSGRVPA